MPNLTVSANVDTLMQAVSFAAFRTSLGVAIGSDVQAYDADLATWATITPGTGVATALAVAVGSAGAFAVFGGVGNFSTIVGTSSLTLGVASTTVGSIVLKNATNAFTTMIQSGVVGANKTWTWPTGYGSAGQVLTDAAGDGVLSWATAGGSSASSHVALFNSYL